MMNDKTFTRFKRWIENMAITIMVLLGISNIILSLPYRFEILSLAGQYYRFLHPDTVVIHRTLSTISGFVLLFLSYRLFKRMRTAWIITLCILPVSLLLHVIRFHYYINIFTILEFFIVIILILGYKDFNKATDPIILKWGITIASVSILLVLLNTALGLFLLKDQFRNIHDFEDSLVRSIQLLFNMDIYIIEPKTRATVLYCESAIALNWISILIAIVLVLKPLIYQPIVSKLDREKIRNYLNLYGYNPIAYVAVEDDKKYYFSSNVKGAIAYSIANGVAVCAGDPICQKEDAIILLSEFVVFCRENDIDICFCQTTDALLSHYRTMGFGIIKYGEEAMFNLQTYNISGGKAAKVRQAINNANRAGIEVYEYKPLEHRSSQLENQIMEVSKEWLTVKKSSELSFMLGSVALENPMDRRYFIAVDAEKTVQGFVVFVPFQGKKGYYADVTRKRKNASNGVMEKIIISAFETMKDEGVQWGSLGLAPLANVRESEENKPIVGLTLEFIYENLNNFYGFKTLHQYKRKYGPTIWETRFLAYYPNKFTPKIAYSIIKVQNPKGVTDYFLTQIKQIFTNKSIMKKQ